MQQTLKRFRDYLNRIQQYEQACALISWDLQTAAPENSAEAKAGSLGFFSTESFRLSTADVYGEMLEELSRPQNFSQLDEAMQVTVRRCSRDYFRFKRVPESFYTEYVTTRARSGKIWEQAKRENNYALFAPWLDKLIHMTKEYVHYMEPDKDAYEVLLDMYEEGIDSASIDSVFASLREGLKPLLEKIRLAGTPDLSALEGEFDIEAQKKVQDMLLRYIGFRFTSGGVGLSEHPFTTTLCADDVRITNHFHSHMPLSSMFSAIHEGGHAIFEQNVDPVYRKTAAEQINLMGLHESQSRFYENILGRNPDFWIPLYDELCGLLPPFRKVPFETFCRAINDVRPSLIRIEADEVTYCMHIILRYEMEKAIFHDQIPADRLPGLWNDKMEELLGIRPASDSEGILQDTHWSDASFGYFPSYLLGSIYDGMFLEQAEAELGDLNALLREGKVARITEWLNQKIHRFGSLYTSREVLERVCGRELTAEPLLRYFNEKYGKIYGF